MIEGPDTKYMMMFGGGWRPVQNMLDAANRPTTLALRATVAVLYIAPLHPREKATFVPIVVNPGDILERFDRDAEARKWETEEYCK